MIRIKYLLLLSGDAKTTVLSPITKISEAILYARARLLGLAACSMHGWEHARPLEVEPL